MSEPDEYDPYYLPVDPEDFAAIDAATARALAQDNIPGVGFTSQTQPGSRSTTREPASPPSPDEYDEYDLSEFTADDFVQIDAFVAARADTTPLYTPSPTSTPASHAGRSEDGHGGGGEPGVGRARGDHGDGNGGPQIQIAIEGAACADSSSSRNLKGAVAGHAPSKSKRSPYDQFRSWNRQLSVSDLTGPSW